MNQNKVCVALLLTVLVALGACEEQPAATLNARNKTVAVTDSCSLNFDIDTIRFQNSLTQCQARQVYYRKFFEEDYRRIDDTARVALRFTWDRSFHEPVIIRLENRATIRLSDSTSRREVWQEWFATYKANIRKLNRDFVVQKGNRRLGKVPPFVFQQSVQVLPVNETPTIIAALDSIGFWQMKTSYPAPLHTDGSSWMLEVYRNGRYHEVSTDMQEHPIKEICLQLIRLSKYPATPDEIY